MTTSKKGSSPHERLWVRFLEVQGGGEFRRQDFAEVVYQHIRPRKMDTAREIAGFYIDRARRAGQLVKAGHVHWKQVTLGERKLLSGRAVKEADDVVPLTLDTRCPAKWVAVDLETGDVWGFDATGRATRASYDASADASAILANAGDQALVELRAQVAQLTKECDVLREAQGEAATVARVMALEEVKA